MHGKGTLREWVRQRSLSSTFSGVGVGSRGGSLRLVVKVVVLTELHSELAEVLHERGDGAHAGNGVVAQTDVCAVRLLLLLADDEDEVVLRQLAVADLLVQGEALVRADLGDIALVVQLLGNTHGVVLELRVDGDDERLAGREPEGPLAAVVLREDGDHTLDRAKHGAVHNHRARRDALDTLGGSVLELETLRQLEVELNGGALVSAAKSILDLDVNLGAVEGAIARLDLPRVAKLVERILQRLLGSVPLLDVTQELLRASAEVEVKGEVEDAVDIAQELQTGLNLALNLGRQAEDVCVVLLEAADAGEAGEGARELVAVQHAKVGEANGQLLVRADAVAEHQAVARAVHRLQSKLLLLHFKAEHVVLVVVPVAGGLPQPDVVHVGADDLSEAALPVLGLDEGDQLVVDVGAARQEEAAARRELVEEEELLLLADLAVVALGSLLLQNLPLLEQLFVRERNAIDALQALSIGLALPVGGRGLQNSQCLDAAGVGDVRAAAEVDKRAAAVDGGGGGGDLLVDDALLELVVLKHLQQILLGHLQALEGLLLLDGLVHELLQIGEVVLRDGAAVQEGVVVEAVLDRRAVAEAAAGVQLHSLAENVCAGVPEHSLGLVVVELEEHKVAVTLQRAGVVPQLAVDLADDNIAREALADAHGYVERGRAPGLALDNLAVWQLDLDGRGHLGGKLGLVLCVQLVEDLDAIGNVRGSGVHRGRSLLLLRLLVLLLGAAGINLRRSSSLHLLCVVRHC
eukprot:m.120929 g.120929  ORF g.120929 m.120929 type:complete len:748 (-) comp16189_c0_seq1:23-2266(-)